MTRPFKGTINLDIRDSKPDWPAFLADTAPKNAPDVLVILLRRANPVLLRDLAFGVADQYAHPATPSPTTG